MIPRDELYQYYVVEHHSAQETMQLFSLSRDDFRQLKNLYGLRQHTNAAKACKRVTAKELEQFYIVESHTRSETCQHFNICPDTLDALMRLYKLRRTAPKMSMEDLVSLVPYEDLYQYYHIQNHSRPETAQHFNLTEHSILRLLQYYDLRKINKWAGVEDVAAKISREEIVQYYVTENHSRAETERYLGLNHAQFCELAGYYKISKQKIRESFSSIKQRVSKADIEQYYTSGHSLDELCQHFNVARDAMYKLFHYYDLDFRHGTSWYEDDIVRCLPPDCQIQRNVRGLLENRSHEIDIYLPDYKIGIEFNGNFWHSSTVRAHDYHIRKSKMAKAAGIRLIHIFEWEWNDPHRQQLLESLIHKAVGCSRYRILAEDCSVQLVSEDLAQAFNNSNSLQKHQSAQVAYGLFYQDRLIQLMSFDQNSSKKRSWKIVGSCAQVEVDVEGGLTKLLMHFVREHQPDSITCLCDFNRFTGHSYEQLGLKHIGYTTPDKYWLFPDGTTKPLAEVSDPKVKSRATGQLWGAGYQKFRWLAEMHLPDEANA